MEEERVPKYFVLKKELIQKIEEEEFEFQVKES